MDIITFKMLLVIMGAMITVAFGVAGTLAVCGVKIVVALRDNGKKKSKEERKKRHK